VDRCPKCDRERHAGEAACARCGLLVERWDTFVAEAPRHPLLDPLWEALCDPARWRDEAAHARFLDEAARTGGLDLAAARYRAASRERPEDARAQAGLARAALLAERLHDAGAHGRVEARLVRLAGLLVAALLLAVSLWLVALSLRR
jgi:hypothetical protein